MAGGVGLDALLPVDSTALWYPLSLLHPDPETSKMKKLDRQRLLTIGYYNAYRHAARWVRLHDVFWNGWKFESTINGNLILFCE